jgi:hypothetical protein
MPIDTSMLPFSKPPRKEKAATRYRTGRLSIMEKCIDLSARIVTHKAVCLRCANPTRKVLDAHHICKRARKKTVALVENQIPLCRYDCHRFAEDNPEAFQAWLDEKLPGRRAEMEAINRMPGKVDWDATYAGLVREAKAKRVTV